MRGKLTRARSSRLARVGCLKGFTLTEAVIASSLLVLAVVPILKALTSAHVTANIIKRRTRCLVLAQAKLDEIRAKSIYNYAADFSQSNVSLDGPYLCTVQDNPADTNLRKIAVTVGHDSNGDNTLGTGEDRVSLVTLVARRW
jgi:Tfp pilus assembly protein PilV